VRKLNDYDDNDIYAALMSRVMKPYEVARVFSVSPSTVTRWAMDGKLTSCRTLGGHRRFYAQVIIDILIADGLNVNEACAVVLQATR